MSLGFQVKFIFTAVTLGKIRFMCVEGFVYACVSVFSHVYACVSVCLYGDCLHLRVHACVWYVSVVCL